MYDVILVHIGENETYQLSDRKIIIIFNNYFNYYYYDINFPTEQQKLTKLLLHSTDYVTSDCHLLKNKFEKTLRKLPFDILNSEDDTIDNDTPNLIKRVKLAQNVEK